MVIAAPQITCFLSFLLWLHFKSKLFKILVTNILFGAENDAATRFCLTALLSALQKMCEKRAWPTTPSIISFTNFDNNEYYFFDQRGSFEAKPHELFFASCTFNFVVNVY